MTKSGKVFIIILNWNCRDATIACLESVHKIDYSPFEVIVVDNGSTDGSPAAIRSRFKDVVLIEEKANLGFCAGNNAAIRYGLQHDADYFLILNNDTLVEPSVVRELKGALDSDPKIAAVSPILVESASKSNFHGIKIDWGNGDFCAQYTQAEIERLGAVVDIDFTTWCAVLISRQAIEKAGLLDEDFFCYYEDMDWGVRCRQSGMRTTLYPKILVYHKGSLSTGGAYSPTVCHYLFRNRMIFMRKHAVWARKLQFSITYIEDFVRRYSLLVADGQRERADAVADGVWSALMGCARDNRIKAPEKIKNPPGLMMKLRLYYLTMKAVFKRPEKVLS